MSVLVVGNAAHLDLILNSDTRPGDSGFGFLNPTPGSGGRWSEGGAAMTIALAIVRSGGRAKLWHPLPQRDHPDIGLHRLTGDGVDIGLSCRYDGEPVRSVIVYGKDWRLGWSVPPTPASLDVTTLDPAAITEIVIAPIWGDWADAAMDWAGAHGIPATLVGFTDDRAMSHRWDRIIVDEAQAADLKGCEAGEWVITDGARGARRVTAEGEIHIPATPASVVDTTGAGDTFAGTYIGARAAGQTVDQAGRLAALRAARVCETWGSRPSAEFFETETTRG